MRINDKINVIGRQTTSGETFGHIRVGGEGLPRFNVLLDGLWVAGYTPPNAEIKQNPSCAIRMAVQVLNQKGQRRHSPPRRLRGWMDEEALRQGQVTRLEGMYLHGLLFPLLRRGGRRLLPRENRRHGAQETLQSARGGHATAGLR